MFRMIERAFGIARMESWSIYRAEIPRCRIGLSASHLHVHLAPRSATRFARASADAPLKVIRSDMKRSKRGLLQGMSFGESDLELR